MAHGTTITGSNMIRVKGAAMLAVSLVVAAQPVRARELPQRSVVNGQRLQPRDRDLKDFGYSDVTSSQAAEVDRLYRELTQSSTSKHVPPR